MSDHVGCRLIFFLSVVGNFFLVLSVVSFAFCPNQTLYQHDGGQSTDTSP